MRCAIHPEVETNLACGKCGQPICPKCMVMGPVGARCPKCARVRRPPTYQLSAVWYLRAAGAGLGAAIAVGAVWWYLSRMPLFGFFNLIAAGAAGYLIGEITSRAVNRKRNTWLAVIGSLAFIFSFLISFSGLSPFWLVLRFGIGLFDLLALALGVYLAQSRLR